MPLKYVYEVEIPAMSIHVEAKDEKEALEKARWILKKVFADKMMKTEHWKTTAHVFYE